MSWVRRLLRLPPGSGVLLRPRTKAKLALSVVGGALTAVLDMVGVATLIPVSQLLIGSPIDSGALGVIWRLTGQPDTTTLATILLVGVVLAFVIKTVITLAFRWWQLGFLSGEAIWAATMLLRGYLRPPYALHLRRNVSEFVYTVGDAVGLAYGGVIGGLLALISEGLSALGLIAVLVSTSPVPAAIALTYLAAVAVWLARYVGRRSRKLAELRVAESQRAFQAVLYSLGGVKEIIVRHDAETFAARFAKARTNLVQIERRLGFLGEVPRYVLELSFITGVALLVVSTLAIQGPGAAVTSIAVFIAAGFRLLPGIVRMIAAASSVRAGIPGLELVLADLPGYVRLKPERREDEPTPLTGDLVLEGVSFRYPGSEVDVVRDVSVTVPRGSSLAIVGLSGSGKSTLVNLILGLLEPDEGTIRVDGRNIADDLWAWQAGLSLVPQPVYIFEGTVRDNVTFARDPAEVDDERALGALRRAALDELLETRGLDSAIGGSGMALSGGQQQRMGLARAFYYEPSTLVLDEATSALDGITERRITETIEALGDDVTTIVIAHRLSTIQHSDQLIYLEDGRVAARGTFDEVYRANATFRRLVELGSLTQPDPEGAEADPA